MTLPEPHSVAIMPSQYRYVWQLLVEPLSAAELRPLDIPPRNKSNQLRPLVRRGWLTRDPSGIYHVTERAREAVCW